MLTLSRWSAARRPPRGDSFLTRVSPSPPKHRDPVQRCRVRLAFRKRSPFHGGESNSVPPLSYARYFRYVSSVDSLDVVARDATSAPASGAQVTVACQETSDPHGSPSLTP